MERHLRQLELKHRAEANANVFLRKPDQEGDGLLMLWLGGDERFHDEARVEEEALGKHRVRVLEREVTTSSGGPAPRSHSYLPRTERGKSIDVFDLTLLVAARMRFATAVCFERVLF